MFEPDKIIEYRVRPVTRYVVTRYHRETTPTGSCSGGSEPLGEFQNEMQARFVADALMARDDPSATFVDEPRTIPEAAPE